MQTSKPSVRINLRIDSYFNPGGTKLLHHGVEISNAKIDHPVLIGIAEILAVVRKGSKDSRSCLLRSRFLAVIGWHKIDAEMVLVPLGHRRRIFRSEEQASDSSNILHSL